MTTYTRHELKQDKFIDAAHAGASWAETHRNQVIGIAIAAIVVIAAIIAGFSIASSRSLKAQDAFGAALRTYTAEIRPPGVPGDAAKETYGSTAERDKAALSAFEGVAGKYSSTESGHNAMYYAGVAAAGIGQNQAAEDQLKKAANHGSAELASLADMALANLYYSTGRDQQAIDLYKHLIDHPTNSVPAVASKLALASLYEKTNPQEARRLWAQVKDSDKGPTGQPGAAGQIAADKLSGKSSS